MAPEPRNSVPDAVSQLLGRARAAHGEVMRHVRDNCSQFCSNLGGAAGRASLQPRTSGGPAFASITHRSSSGGSSSREGGAAAPPPAAAVPSSGRISKEAVGRASWTFLHALAAQYPDLPSRQQRRDVENLIDILTRMYPCADCAKHFKEIVRANPVRAASRRELQLWMCEAHNAVNRSIGKPVFNCALVEARWGALDCEHEAACSLSVGAARP